MVEAAIDERTLGLQRLAEGDTAAAAAHFWAALSTGSTAEDLAHYLGLSLCLAGDDSGFLRVVAACRGDVDAQLDFYHTILLDLSKRGAWDALSRHAAATPEGTRLHAIATYYAGCAELVRGQHDRAVERFMAFRRTVLAQPKCFPLIASAKFNLIFRQACLLEPPDTVAALMEQPEVNFSHGRPQLERVGAWTAPAAGPVFLCCCDTAYFQRFAAELCRTMAAWQPDAIVHFHVVNLDPANAAAARALAASHGIAVNLSFEPAPGWRHNVYYACNRFLVAPAIMDWYGRAPLIIDADSAIRSDLGAVIAAATRFDFACFATARTEPASVFQAGLTYFADNARGRRLLETVARLIIPKLDMSPLLSWLLDQAALYSAIRHAERSAPETTVGDLTAITGRFYLDFIASLGSEAEKSQMMIAARSVTHAVAGG